MAFFPRTAFLGVRMASPLVAVLAGCSGEPWNDPYPAEDARANVYYDSFSERPKHLDPVRAYSADEYEFIAQIYEPPLQYHFLDRPYRLEPLTAESMPRPEYLDAASRALPDDASTETIAYSRYRIRIRPGIRYQPHPALARGADGSYLYHDLSRGELAGKRTPTDFPKQGTRELQAADYVYQLKRMADPGLHSPIAGFMGRYIVGLAGLGQRLAKVREAGGVIDLREYDLEGARVLDRYTYEILVHGKYPQFLYWQAMPFFAPVPWEVERFYAQPGMRERNLVLDWYPLGTGPFMLTENDPNLRMVLERNPHYRGDTYPAEGEPGDAALGLLADAGQPLPFIDRAVYSLEKEAMPSWNKFLQGYYDASGIGSDNFGQAVTLGEQGAATLTGEMKRRGIRLLTAVTTSMYYMGFNMQDPVVGGLSKRARNLRQAISIAMDYEEFIAIFLNGRGLAAHGPIPPGIFGHREGRTGVNSVTHVWEEHGAVRRPLANAHRLLAEAGYAGGRDPATGRPLVLYFDTVARGPDSKAQHGWLVKQFGKLGLQLVIRGTDYNRFREKVRTGAAQIFQWGWNADYPDPENFLFLLYGRNAKVDYGGENAANYRNPRFDALFQRMRNMDNGPQRQAIIDEMIDVLRVDAPWVWGFHPKSYALHHGWYRNAKPNLMANNTLKYKRIDAEARAEARQAWNRPVLWPVALLSLLLTLSLVPAWRGYRRRELATAR